MRDEKSLAHTRWNCIYHIVFALKYRRQAFYGEKRRAIGAILRKLFDDLKFKYRNSEFWCRVYYVDTVGKNTAKIQD